MGMIGQYARLTPEEFVRALDDPEWAHEHVLALSKAAWDDRTPPERARCLDVDKAWDAIRFLLERAGLPDVVHGGEPVPGAPDWGYTPPLCLTPERVREAAGALSGTAFEVPARGVRAADLAEAGVYPSVWEDEEELEYVGAHYEALRRFLAAAAEEGDTVLTWIS